MSRLKSFVTGNTRKQRRGEAGESLLGNKRPQSATRRANKEKKNGQTQANFERDFRGNMNTLLKPANKAPTTTKAAKKDVTFANNKGRPLEQIKTFKKNNVVAKPAAPKKTMWNNNWENNPFAKAAPLPASFATPNEEWDPFGTAQPKRTTVNNNNPFAEASRQAREEYAAKKSKVPTENLLGLNNLSPPPKVYNASNLYSINFTTNRSKTVKSGRTTPKSRFIGASAPLAVPVSGLASLNTPSGNRENTVFPPSRRAGAGAGAGADAIPLFRTNRMAPNVSAQRANEQLTLLEQKLRNIEKLKGNSAAKNARIAALEAQLKTAEARVKELTLGARQRAAISPFAR